MELDTLSGIKKIKVFTKDGEVSKVMVDMGKAELETKKIPINLKTNKVIGEEVNIEGTNYEITGVSMGNPHCIVFFDEVDNLCLEEIGPQFESNKLFPERVNTEFIKVIDKNHLKMRVWERGSGETLACGTGACAAAVAAVLNGYCNKNEDINVALVGGELTIKYTDDGTVYMTGDAQKIFDGVVRI